MGSRRNGGKPRTGALAWRCIVVFSRRVARKEVGEILAVVVSPGESQSKRSQGCIRVPTAESRVLARILKTQVPEPNSKNRAVVLASGSPRRERERERCKSVFKAQVGSQVKPESMIDGIPV